MRLCLQSNRQTLAVWRSRGKRRTRQSWRRGAVAQGRSPCRSATGSANARAALAEDAMRLNRSRSPDDLASCRGATGRPPRAGCSRVRPLLESASNSAHTICPLQDVAMFRVTKEIDFCYGHRLLNYDGKCKHLHGHNGKAVIVLEGTQLDHRGMVVDFSDIKKQVAGWIMRWSRFASIQPATCFLMSEKSTTIPR